MLSTIDLSQGERLQMLITAKNAGTPIVLDGTYLVDAWIAGEKNNHPPETLAPTIDGAGKIAIDFDTLNLPRGSYLIDIRVSSSAGHDQWSEKIQLLLDSTITPPTAR